jgi:CBS domain-containing protein
MQVGDMMHANVKTASPDETFADVAKLMRLHGISSVVVLDGMKLAGIVTERDIVNLIAAGGDPHEVKVAHGMTRRDLETVSPKTDIASRRAHGERASDTCP